MKNQKMFYSGLILTLGLLIGSYQKAEASPPVGVNFQIFYNELSPFGDWVMDPVHGYVWIPSVAPDFHPYATNGYWTMTNYGNTWVSHYDWGWAPFHYGRWMWDNFYGWAWVPGYEWGPAWVNWRSGGGYYGWAPLGPGMGVHVSMYMPRTHWVFIPQRRFMHRNFYRYCVPSYQVVNVINRTTVINNTYVHNNRTYAAGPDRREIERATRKVVPVYQVQNSDQPGRAALRNNSLAVYRPDVRREVTPQNQPRPSRAYTSEEYKQKSANQTRMATPTSRNAMRESGSSPYSNETRNRNSFNRGSEAINPERRMAPAYNALENQRYYHQNERVTRPTNSRGNVYPNSGGNQVMPSRNEGTRMQPAQAAPQRNPQINIRNSQPRVNSGVQQYRQQAPQRVAPSKSGSTNRNVVRPSSAPVRSSGQSVSGSSSRNSNSAGTATRSVSGSRSGSRGNN